MTFQYTNLCQVPHERLKPWASPLIFYIALGTQQMVMHDKTMFEPYDIKNYSDLSHNLRFPTMWYVRPAYVQSIRAFASRLNILGLLRHWPNIIWSL